MFEATLHRFAAILSTDVILAIVVAAAPGLASYLGWRLIANPLEPTDNKRKRRFEIGFIICGLAGIVSVAVSTYRSGALLGAIETNTEKPTEVTVNVPPAATQPPAPAKSKGFIQIERIEFREPILTVGGPLSLDIHIRNNGTDAIYNVHRFYQLGLEDSADVKTEEDSIILDKRVHSKFLVMLRRNTQYKSGVLSQMGVGGEEWITLGYNMLTDAQVSGIINGNVRLYLFIHARWDNESRDADICTWLQKTESVQITTSNTIWHDCNS